MEKTLLVAALTCLVTLTVTTLYNYMLNKPKKRRQEKEKIEEQRQRDKLEILSELKTLDEKILSKFKEQDESIKTIRLGMQASLKNDLKLRYDSWIKKGYAPMDAKDDLERMYQVYHNLGANGVMDAHREKFLELPNSKQSKVKEGEGRV